MKESEGIKRLLAGLNASRQSNEELSELLSQQFDEITELKNQVIALENGQPQPEPEQLNLWDTGQEQDATPVENPLDIMGGMLQGLFAALGKDAQAENEALEQPNDPEKVAEVIAGPFNAIQDLLKGLADCMSEEQEEAEVEAEAEAEAEDKPVNLEVTVKGKIMKTPWGLAKDRLAEAPQFSTLTVTGMNGGMLFIKEDGEVRLSTVPEYYHFRSCQQMKEQLQKGA